LEKEKAVTGERRPEWLGLKRTFLKRPRIFFRGGPNRTVRSTVLLEEEKGNLEHRDEADQT